MPAMPAGRYIFGTLPWYSALIATGIVFALWWACREEKRLSLPKDTMIDLALRVIPLGIIGARLYYVVFAWDTFAGNPITALYIWQGGLAIYGGVIGGVLGAMWYCRRKKISLLRVLDAIALGVVMAQAIGRWGNYFNMEAYGAAVADPALQFFPFAVLIPGANGSTWHMATFFYESMWNLGVFITLALLRRRVRRDGDVTLWYLLLYGAGRLIIEGLRTDSLMAGSSVRISQLLSAALCMLAIGVFVTRVPAMRTKRALWQAAASGAVWAALAIAGRDRFVFAGYPVVLALASLLAAATVTAAGKRLCAALPVAMLIACHMMRFIPLDGMSDIVYAISCCALLSAMMIVSAASAYAVQPAASRDTQESPTA